MTIRRPLAVLAMAAMALLLGAGAAGAGAAVPFKGSDVGTFGVPLLCGDGGLNVVIGGEGTATNLGLTRD